MGRVLESLKSLFSRRHTRACGNAADDEELRTLFKARYHSFKLLLNANNKALDIMADMDQALRAGRAFGMTFIRANATALSVNVFKMIKGLDDLAPGTYRELETRFHDIQERINRILTHQKLPEGRDVVVPLDGIDNALADQVGSKMANLGEIRNRVRLDVPEGFVISALAYQRFMEHNDLQAGIDKLLQASTADRMDELYRLSAHIQQLIIDAEVPEDIRQAIGAAYRELERRTRSGVRVSLRSSALGEDISGSSFAGQYRSELNVSPENLDQVYKEVVASKYSLPALTYRMNRGIRDEDIAMCVGCMTMVEAVSGGVMYSRNPINIRDDAVFINASWGLPKSVVDGSVDADLFVVSRESPRSIVAKSIGTKERVFLCYPEEGVCRLETTVEQATSPSISDEQAAALAGMALQLEEYYGPPQDIEWVIAANGTTYVLQCRELQQIEPLGQCRRDGQRGGEAGEVLLQGGVTASPGVASGPVFHVRKSIDTLRFPEGAVLVASQALPVWAALLHRAAAVVTEHGGVAGHLANVAREFAVPAVFGIPEALSTLHSGELVTVDADGLRIYAGRLEPLLLKEEPKKNLMIGSPVHELLTEVVQHTTPLTLLDPDAPQFKAGNCRTLHDITRFIHEKAVREMFNFGREHRFAERSSKRLVCEVPMQWWIINLDDGFRRNVETEYVDLDTIVSIPMLALWEGIIAIPWEGPPPVDARGFMSVLLQATANPSLDPSMHSEYANRNYFMVSRNFCSLTSRFGFHFSTVEALVGERDFENYISFQFKGGAADYQRRLKRAWFVADMLSEFDFTVEVKEDAVFARLEGRDQEFMKERLRILGYLTIHTRQLDMIMSNDATARRHWLKIMQDLHSLIQTTGQVSVH
jgi:pyruvate,water dikinase